MKLLAFYDNVLKTFPLPYPNSLKGIQNMWKMRYSWLMQAIRTSETSVYFNKAKRHYIPEATIFILSQCLITLSFSIVSMDSL
jgi:hypothetical protein